MLWSYTLEPLLNSSTGASLATGSNRKLFSWPVVVRESCRVSSLPHVRRERKWQRCHMLDVIRSTRLPSSDLSSAESTAQKPYISVSHCNQTWFYTYCNCTQFDLHLNLSQLTLILFYMHLICLRSIRNETFHFQCVGLHVWLPWFSMYSMSSSLNPLPPFLLQQMECVIWCRRRHTLTLNRSSQGVCSNWIISKGLPSSVIAVTVSLISLLSW